MPTYTCWAEPGVVPVESRKLVAQALTEIHHEVGRAPRYFVQVVFAELTPDSVFIAGQSAPPHLWVRADIRDGRTPDQKREILARITRELGELLDLPPEEVWVYICDIPGENMIEYGRPLPDPGGEDRWFADLPEDLQKAIGPLA